MIKLSSKGHKHEHVMVDNGQPPRRASFKVKSRTYLTGQEVRANNLFEPI
jgi:hypothetical protein